MLRTEADVVATLQGRTLTLEELYDACRDAGVTGRDRGHDVIHGRNDRRWQRRVRGHLQQLRRRGQAHRVAAGTWVLNGTRVHPLGALLVVVPGELGQVELVLGDAAELLRRLTGDGCATDLIVADPPWQLQRQLSGDPVGDRSERFYARDPSRVVNGYVEVDPGAYREFTLRWVAAAAGLLAANPGSYLAAITGPQQAARVQVAAEDAGLQFVNQLVVRRAFALPTSRRFSHAHTVVSVLSSGASRQRFFATPPDLPKSAAGNDYPLDVWCDVPKHERRGLLRYDNMLAPQLVARLLWAYTPGPGNGGQPWSSQVVDPFVGGGTTLVTSLAMQRRFVGGDLNPQALRFALARSCAEPLPGLHGPTPPQRSEGASMRTGGTRTSTGTSPSASSAARRSQAARSR
jgi:hypothetical protein